MVDTAKAKINLKEGIFEVEGSEDFIINLLNKFEKDFKSGSIPVISQNKKNVHEIINNVKNPVNPDNIINIPPIPLDFKGYITNPSLKDFYSEKSPKNSQELITLFVYFISKYLGIQNVHVGHIISCYNEVSLKVPNNIERLLHEIKIFSGWLNLGNERKTVIITSIGEQFIENDLPKHKQPDINIINNITKDK